MVTILVAAGLIFSSFNEADHCIYPFALPSKAQHGHTCQLRREILTRNILERGPLEFIDPPVSQTPRLPRIPKKQTQDSESGCLPEEDPRVLALHVRAGNLVTCAIPRSPRTKTLWPSMAIPCSLHDFPARSWSPSSKPGPRPVHLHTTS